MTIPVRDLFSDGNIYFILSKAHRAARKAGWSKEKWTAFEELAKSEDYDKVLQVVMTEFHEMDSDE